MEDDVGELLRLLFERDLEVVLPEEFRVGEAGGEDLFVTGDDRGAAVACLDIRDADEVRGERALRVGEREIFLVGAHGELDHLARDFEEGGVEPAEQRHRPFGQPGIFDQEPLVLHQLEPSFASRRCGAVGDDAAALGGIEDDVAGAQLLGIIVGRADGDDPGMVEAVADGRRARADSGDLELDDLLAQQSDDALQGAHPAHVARAPAHRLGPGKGADDGGDRLGKHRGGRAPGPVDDGEVRAVALDKLVLAEAGLAQEPFERLGRRRGARPLGLLAHRFGLGRKAARDQRQPARSRVGLYRLCGEPGLLKLGLKKRGQVLASLGLHPGGNFLGEELEQEIRAHAAHPFFCIQPWSAPFARSRTRPI